MVDTKEHKQSDIAKKFNLNAVDIKAFRDKHLVHDTDWEKVGTTIMWTDRALWLLKNSIERPVPENIQVEDVFVISPAANSRFVYGILNGLKIVIECNPRDSARLVKKNIKVDVRVENGETYYSYKK